MGIRNIEVLFPSDWGVEDIELPLFVPLTEPIEDPI